MKLLFLLSISFFLAMNAWAQISPCESPPMLIGSFSVIGQEGNLMSGGQYAYDALQEQIYISDYGSYNNKTFSTNLLIQFEQGVMYEIDTSSSTCTMFALTNSFHPLQVPTNATFLTEIILGTTSVPDMSLLINVFEGQCPETNAKYTLTFSQFTCLPVSAVFYTKETGWIVMSFFDQLLGIENPMNFFPPSFCETAPIEPETLPKIDFFSALKSAVKN